MRGIEFLLDRAWDHQPCGCRKLEWSLTCAMRADAESSCNDYTGPNGARNP